MSTSKKIDNLIGDIAYVYMWVDTTLFYYDDLVGLRQSPSVWVRPAAHRQLDEPAFRPRADLTQIGLRHTLLAR